MEVTTEEVTELSDEQRRQSLEAIGDPFGDLSEKASGEGGGGVGS